MTDSSQATLDITPHPHILSVFADIEFSILQCFCELIDNSVDGFLDAKRMGQPISNPEITIATGQETVQIVDNGPGMTLERLEKAVKAGWTSKNGAESLGLYGMGFNIATARLGQVTRIWTTTSGSTQWHGIEIDLAKLAQREDFKIPLLTRPKSLPETSGTSIEITKLRPEWNKKLTGQSFKNNVIDRFSRVYKSMLREQGASPIHFRLIVNNRRVSAWEHVTWPDSKFITTKSTNEIIHAIERFDVTFGKKYLSRTTGELFTSPDDLEPDDVIEIPERVHGWVGVQKYIDENDYGIDIIRNGRVIEMATKDLFFWEDDDGKLRKEYSIDDKGYRGRIVGEIHLDHGYVYYTKNKFERNRSSWKQLLKAVRDNEPLTHRGDDYDNEKNMSPLGKIFRAFRRTSPQRGTTYSNILAFKDWEKAKTAAEKYRAGDATYRSEEWWEKALEESDKTLLESTTTTGTKQFDVTKAGSSKADKPGATSTSTATPDTMNSDGQSDGGATAPGSGSGSPQPEPVKPSPPQPKREPLGQQSLKVKGPLSEQPYDVKVFALETVDQGHAMRGRITTKGYEIDVNLAHPVFHSASFQVEDAVLAEAAHYIAEEENKGASGTQRVEFGDLLANLRADHAKRNSLEVNSIQLDSQNLLKRIGITLGKALTEQQQAELLSQLPEERQGKIKLAHAKHGSQKQMAEFLSFEDLALLVERAPALLLGHGLVKVSWTPASLESSPDLLSLYHQGVEQKFKSLVYAIVGFSPRPEEPVSQASLMYTRAALNLLDESVA